MPPIQAILWDVGGTLLVDGVFPEQSIRNRLTHAGVDHAALSDDFISQSCDSFLKNERYWRTLEDEFQDQHAYAKILLEKLGVAVDAFRVDAVARSLANYYDVLSPVPGIIELLQKIKGSGVRQAVVSNWPPSLPLVLKHFELDHFFNPIVFSAEDGIHKPDIRIFQRALSIMNLQPDEALFIGDIPEWDIIPTRAMGMHAIHFDPRRRDPNSDSSTVSQLQKLIFDRLL